MIPPGTTPHTRGKGKILTWIVRIYRNNPAYAGKRWKPTRTCGQSSEQSHTCGEKTPTSRTRKRPRGTTPHARGKDGSPFLVEVGLGINPARAGKSRSEILGASAVGNNPAYAGKSLVTRSISSALAEQPRVRGEKSGKGYFRVPESGTTPRTRGKDFTTSIFSEQLSSFHSTVPSTLVQCAPQSQHLNSSRPLNH